MSRRVGRRFAFDNDSVNGCDPWGWQDVGDVDVANNGEVEGGSDLSVLAIEELSGAQGRAWSFEDGDRGRIVRRRRSMVTVSRVGLGLLVQRRNLRHVRCWSNSEEVVAQRWGRADLDQQDALECKRVAAAGRIESGLGNGLLGLLGLSSLLVEAEFSL